MLVVMTRRLGELVVKAGAVVLLNIISGRALPTAQLEAYRPSSAFIQGSFEINKEYNNERK